MLDTDTKRRIDTARDILVGKVPDPKSQVEQITIALIYKFMDDMDAESEELGGQAQVLHRRLRPLRLGQADALRPWRPRDAEPLRRGNRQVCRRTQAFLCSSATSSRTPICPIVTRRPCAAFSRSSTSSATTTPSGWAMPSNICSLCSVRRATRASFALRATSSTSLLRSLTPRRTKPSLTRLAARGLPYLGIQAHPPGQYRYAKGVCSLTPDERAKLAQGIQGLRHFAGYGAPVFGESLPARLHRSTYCRVRFADLPGTLERILPM